MAGMQADDRGFFQPRKLQREFGFSDDDFKILIAKSYFILFESGVMVVTDWNKNNWLDNRRITETEYVEELKLLKLVNSKYELENNCLADAKPMLSQYSIEENSIEENSIEKENIKRKNECNNNDTVSIRYQYGNDKTNTIMEQEKPKRKKAKKSFVPPTLEEIQEYIEDNELVVDAKKFYKYFTATNWVDSKGNKVNSWKRKLITWDKKSAPVKQDKFQNLREIWEES